MKNIKLYRLKRSIQAAILVSILFLSAMAFAQTADKWSFIVMGDSRSNAQMWYNIMSLVAKDPSNPEMVFHTGDLVNFGINPKAWKQYDRGIAMLGGKIPVYAVVGNHETIGDKKAKHFIKHTNPPGGKAYYYVKHRDAGFVCLDSYEKGHSGEIGPEQTEWLKNTLTQLKTETRMIFAFIHKPLMTKESYRHPEPLKNHVEIKKIFKEGGVIAVFMGHEHRYDSFEDNGIHYILTAGAGAPLYGKDENALYHYCRVSVEKNEVLIVLIDAKGEESRQVTIPLQTQN